MSNYFSAPQKVSFPTVVLFEMVICTVSKVDNNGIIEALKNGKYHEEPVLPKVSLQGIQFKPVIYQEKQSDPIHLSHNRENQIEIRYTTDSKAYQAYEDGTLEEQERYCRICHCPFKGIGLPIPLYCENLGSKIIYYGKGSYCYKGCCTLSAIKLLYQNSPEKAQQIMGYLKQIWYQLSPSTPIPEINPDLLIENDGCLRFEEMVRNRYYQIPHLIIIPTREVYKKV